MATVTAGTDDLAQELRLAILLAGSKYTVLDPPQKRIFLRRKIIDVLREDRVINRDIGERLTKINKARAAVEKRLERIASNSEVRAESGLSIKHYYGALLMAEAEKPGGELE